MPIFKLAPYGGFACIVMASLMLGACSPKFDWRIVRNDLQRYAIALPGKPATHTRPIDLDGQKVSMTMIATEIGNTTFAVGSADMPDATQAQVSLNAMKLAMVRNIGGEIRQERVLTMPRSTQAGGGMLAVMEIEAIGAPMQTSGGEPRVLHARFVAKDNRVYQLVATGPAKSLNHDAVNTFFSSFAID
jgi:hypothetical protein